ncbi:MAG TPA: fructosamine kinase family protein [Acetobacteraceae bacterium]|nr:fructosamine kinase family protein [Acetobacteraceae bacterium]
MSGLAAAAAGLLGGVVRRQAKLAGGDLSQVVRVTFEDGRAVVVKGGPAPRTEAAMLRAIWASGAPAPEVLAVNDAVLVLEALPGDGRLADGWPSLGRALRQLHATGGDRYGWAKDYAFGSVLIENRWAEDWPQFFAERRLLPHLPHLPASLARRVEALAADLANRLPLRPMPSLLHGDCWGGNVLVADGRVAGLIDPACYYGHNEVDLAMLALFDQPPPEFYKAYGVDGAAIAGRRAIYQLWPALVHVRLFGDPYVSLVERLLNVAGA